MHVFPGWKDVNTERSFDKTVLKSTLNDHVPTQSFTVLIFFKIKIKLWSGVQVVRFDTKKSIGNLTDLKIKVIKGKMYSHTVLGSVSFDEPPTAMSHASWAAVSFPFIKMFVCPFCSYSFL